MDETEFLALPIFKYAICRCGYRGRLSIKRDIYDYINGRRYYTPLYLCSGCHWQMECEYRMWERFFKREFGIDTWEMDDYLTTQQFHAYVMEGFQRNNNRKSLLKAER